MIGKLITYIPKARHFEAEASIDKYVKSLPLSDSLQIALADNVYDLKITNTALFFAFAFENLSSEKGREEMEYKLDIPVGTPAADAEKRFLKFISDKGLTLLKPLNNQYTQWGKVQQINNNIVIVNCNQ